MLRSVYQRLFAKQKKTGRTLKKILTFRLVCYQIKFPHYNDDIIMQFIVVFPVGKFQWKDLKWRYCMCLKTVIGIISASFCQYQMGAAGLKLYKINKENEIFLTRQNWNREFTSKMLSVKNGIKRGLQTQSLASIQDIFFCALFVINMTTNLSSLTGPNSKIGDFLHQLSTASV